MYSQPALYPEGVYREADLIHATHSYTRKCCGCMSLQAGGLLACGIWLVRIYNFSSLESKNSYPVC